MARGANAQQVGGWGERWGWDLYTRAMARVGAAALEGARARGGRGDLKQPRGAGAERARRWLVAVGRAEGGRGNDGGGRERAERDGWLVT